MNRLAPAILVVLFLRSACSGAELAPRVTFRALFHEGPASGSGHDGNDSPPVVLMVVGKLEPVGTSSTDARRTHRLVLEGEDLAELSIEEVLFGSVQEKKIQVWAYR